MVTSGLEQLDHQSPWSIHGLAVLTIGTRGRLLGDPLFNQYNPWDLMTIRRRSMGDPWVTHERPWEATCLPWATHGNPMELH